MFKSLRLCSMPALLKVTSGAPIARGANGPQVAFLQDLLSDLGHPMPRSWKNGRWDGIFGGETDASVRQFQQGKGLRVRPGTHDARAMRRIRTMAAAA